MFSFFRRHALIVVIWCFTAMFSVIAWKFVESVYNVLQARSWEPTACLVTDAHLISKYNGGSRIAATYSYSVQGVEYKSTRYSFDDHTYSSRHSSVPANVQPGKVAKCYVDPDDPTQAVIERGLVPEMFGGLIALFFFLFMGLVSVGGIFQIVEEFRTARGSVARTA